MNPAAPPTVANIRSRIVDRVLGLFRTITTLNNYETDAGEYCVYWQGHAISDNNLPTIAVRDISLEPATNTNGQCPMYHLNFEAVALPQKGPNSAANARIIWADIITLFSINRAIESLGDRVNVTLEYLGDEMSVVEDGQTFAGIKISFRVNFKMSNLDVYSPQP